jgi:hypothetical protein
MSHCSMIQLHLGFPRMIPFVLIFTHAPALPQLEGRREVKTDDEGLSKMGKIPAKESDTSCENLEGSWHAELE